MMDFTAWDIAIVSLNLRVISIFLMLLAASILLVWVIRFGKDKSLKNWVIGLVISGLLVAVISGIFLGKLKHDWKRFKDFPFVMAGEIEVSKCMKSEQCHQEMLKFLKDRQ